MINKELFIAVRDAARQHPDAVDVTEWGITPQGIGLCDSKVFEEHVTGKSNLEILTNGTKLCIGGLAVLLTREFGLPLSTGQLADKVLGLTAEHQKVYYSTSWPEPFKSRMWDARCKNLPQGEIAADFIDWFIENHS